VNCIVKLHLAFG